MLIARKPFYRTLTELELPDGTILEVIPIESVFPPPPPTQVRDGRRQWIEPDRPRRRRGDDRLGSSGG